MKKFKIIVYLFFQVITAYPQSDMKISSIDLYGDRLQSTPTARLSLNDIFSDRYFITENRNQIAVNAFTSYINYLNSLEVDKKLNKRRKTIFDHRILVTINYNDSSAIYVSSGKDPIIEYEGKLYDDRGYVFLIIVARYFEFPMLNEFLKEKGIL